MVASVPAPARATAEEVRGGPKVVPGRRKATRRRRAAAAEHLTDGAMRAVAGTAVIAEAARDGTSLDGRTIEVIRDEAAMLPLGLSLLFVCLSWMDELFCCALLPGFSGVTSEALEEMRRLRGACV